MNVLGTPGSWIDAGSGFLLVALGWFLLSVKPRRRANLALAAFSILFGLSRVVGNLVRDAAGGNPLEVPDMALLAAGAIPLVLVALWIPRATGRQRRPLLLAVGVMAASALAWLASELATPSLNAPYDARWFLLEAVLQNVATGGFYVALLVQALRFPDLAERDRRNAVLLSSALLLFPGWSAGLLLGETAANLPRVFPAFLRDTGLDPATGAIVGGLVILNDTWLVFHLALAGLWLRHAQRTRHPSGPRNVALLALALPLAGMLARPYLGPIPGDAGVNGLMRLLTVAILAYAILRHQLLDIDVKVKWTIRQSTIAAAFVGVFFVVSEGAANLFAQAANSQYLGIAAAGLLVFALAPLQRAAERVASLAVPDAKPVVAMSRDERAELYRAMARRAWEDGHLDRNEAALLRELRQRLALSTDEAERLEAEASAA